MSAADATIVRRMTERSDCDPTTSSPVQPWRPVGLDIAGPDLVVGRLGLRSAFSNRQSHLGRWGGAGDHPLWLSPGDVLRSVAHGDLGDEQSLGAVVAVPGWFGFADRRTLCDALVGDRHEVTAMVASTTAAAVHWYAEQSFRDRRCVLAVDVRFGVTVSVVTIASDGLVERCVTGIRPGVVDSSVEGPLLLDRLVDEVVVRMGSMSLTPFDALVLVAGAPLSGVGSLAIGSLRRVGAAHWPPLEPLVLVNSGCVAEGAALLAAGRHVAEANATAGSWTVSAAAPRGLGVLVERSDGGTEVVSVLEPWTALPTTADAVFADPRDGTQPTPALPPPAVAVQWFEFGVDGAVAATPVLVATFVMPSAAASSSPSGLIDAHLMVNSTGELRPRPPNAWLSTHGPAGIAIAERAPMGSVAEANASDPLLVSVEPFGAPSGPPFDPPVPAEQPSLWFEQNQVPAELQVPAEPVSVPGAETSVPAPDPVEREAFEPPGLTRIDDDLLELLANAEVSPVALDEALLRCERVLSNEVDALVAVRSVYDLLDCDDDTDPDDLRAASRRLEESFEQRGLGDDLAAAVSAAVRAARRSFADPLERRFLGGSRQMLEDELARVVEHLRLVVGEVSDVELRRMVADARRGGLAPNRIASVLAQLVGHEAADRVTDLAADGSQAVVIVDPTSGRCRLAHPDEVGIRIRVMVEQSAFARS